MDPHLEPVHTKKGTNGFISVRDQTSDMSLVFGTFSNRWTLGDDEYDLDHLVVDGVFADVGAHIGIISLAVLLDNPNAKAILVEPIPENIALARRTMMANNFDDRVTFVEAAVGTDSIRYGGDEADDRYVGNIGTHDGHTITVKTITLPALVKLAGGRIAAMKIDCEGGEWGFLDSKALSKVDTIFGEWHGSGDEFNGPERLRALLDPTHEITSLTDVGGIGLFRAVPR